MTKKSKTLSPKQISDWERDGFLVLRDFVSPSELQLITTRIELLVNQEPQNPGIGLDIDPAFRSEAVTNRTKHFRTLFHAAHSDDYLREKYTFRKQTLDTVEDLLGPDIVYYTDQTFLKPPGGTAAPLHQDNAYWEPYWEGPGKLSIWLALDESNLGNGCTHFVPGSHRTRFRHHTDWEDDDVFGRQTVDALDQELSHAVPIELHPGDCCIHHCETLHYSGANPSQTSRRGHVAIFFSSKVRYTDTVFDAERGSDFFIHNFVSVRGVTYSCCVGDKQ